MEHHHWIRFSACLLLFYVASAFSDVTVQIYSTGSTWITLKIQVTESRAHGPDITQYKVIYGQDSDKQTRYVRRSLGEEGTMVTISDLEEGEMYEFSIRPVYSNRNVGAATVVYAHTAGDMGPNDKRGGGNGQPMASAASKPPASKTFIIVSIFLTLALTLLTATA